jgi:hypothetical protein
MCLDVSAPPVSPHPRCEGQVQELQSVIWRESEGEADEGSAVASRPIFRPHSLNLTLKIKKN